MDVIYLRGGVSDRYIFFLQDRISR